MINIGIYGATGYASYELLRLLSRHPKARVVFTTSESQAGKSLADIIPGPLDAQLIAPDDAPLHKTDVVFLGLPHGVSGVIAQRARAADVRVVDLSADFRLHTPADYKRWYDHEHPAPELLPAPYGLPEINRAAIRDATLIANPGCYPTSILLGIAPLLRAAALSDPLIIVDSKSGTSGAGRAPKQNTHFVEVNENLAPYNIGQKHRHVGEMLQEARRLSAGMAPEFIFSPHLLPISRGMLSTIYVRVSPDMSAEQLCSLYTETYANEPFIRLLPSGQLATIAHTVHTNQCAISLTLAAPGQLIIVSSIDNLVKGASGAAVQNMNVMFGLDETEGLR